MDVPMLDEEEWSIVQEKLRGATLATKKSRKDAGASLHETPRSTIYQPALDAFEKITGFHETNVNALYHHRVALYGPPCHKCGRPLRTPRARRCGACMALRKAV